MAVGTSRVRRYGLVRSRYHHAFKAAELIGSRVVWTTSEQLSFFGNELGGGVIESILISQCCKSGFGLVRALPAALLLKLSWHQTTDFLSSDSFERMVKGYANDGD